MTLISPAPAGPTAPHRAPRRPKHPSAPAPAGPPLLDATALLERLEGPVPESGPQPEPVASLVFWPSEAERRDELAAAGRCRVLLLAADTPPPEVRDPFEDWIREPFDGADLQARVQGVEARARRRARTPRLDEAGLLHCGPRSVALSETQAALVGVLVSRVGQLVPLAELVEAYGEVAPVGSVDATTRALQRCRTKLRSIGLDLHTVRAKGFLLSVAPA